MGRRYSKVDHEAYRKEQDERAAKEERERRERWEEYNARRACLAEGGTEEEFEAAWPEIREEARRQRAMNREQEARERQRASAVSRI